MTELRHGDEALELVHGGVTLYRYVFRPRTAPRESPRPFFHPLNTLAGRPASVFRPEDHLWHHGLSMTCAHLSGQNFWGGHTYVRDQGYVQLDNNGRQEHAGFDAVGDDSFDQRLDWLTADGALWLTESRRVAATVDSPAAWSLHFATELTNVSGRTLELSSPTVEGRPMAGYGGLFWRGPAEWTGSPIVNAQMGERAPWIAIAGPDATVAFVDHPSNPRYPTKWFVRSTPYACIAAAFSFDEPLHLAADETLRLRYRVVIADGEWRGP